MSSAKRLLWDIDHSCIRISYAKEKYDIFRTDEEGIAIVRLDAKGSNSVTVPSSCLNNFEIQIVEEEDNDLTWKENLGNLLKSGNGTLGDVSKLLKLFEEELHSLRQSYFRASWFDDADESLPEADTNGSILFERSFNNDKWNICPLNRIRGGRFGKIEKNEDKEFTLSSSNLPQNQKTIKREECIIFGDKHPLFQILKKMCAQPNSIEDNCLFECLHENVNLIKNMKPMNTFNFTQDEIDEKFNEVIDWLSLKKYNLSFSANSLLSSALRCSHLMKIGIDTGTRIVKFPQRGFKDASNDQTDIPREEDRNAKVFLLTLSVFASGSLFYPFSGSFDKWEFRRETTQEEMRYIHSQAEKLVLILSLRSHKVEIIPLTPKIIEKATVERALSYLKGERKLFRHQVNFFI